MKIYTRTGDEGSTGLFGGGRVRKDHVRVAAYGAVDELNAAMGHAVAAAADADVRAGLGDLQHDLFALGAILATAPRAEGRPAPKGVPEPPAGRIAAMEGWIDAATAELPDLRAFILPGGSPGAVALHQARTVCRRAERAVVALAEEEDVPQAVLAYLNRLSDLLFTWARLENHRSGTPDVEWRQE